MGATQQKAKYDTKSVYLSELIGLVDTEIFLNFFIEVTELNCILLLLDNKFKRGRVYCRTENGQNAAFQIILDDNVVIKWIVFRM